MSSQQSSNNNSNNVRPLGESNRTNTQSSVTGQSNDASNLLSSPLKYPTSPYRASSVANMPRSSRDGDEENQNPAGTDSLNTLRSFSLGSSTRRMADTIEGIFYFFFF